MKKNSFLTRLFSHNIVLLILSFLLSFVIWFIINASSETETNVTISNIPVSVTLPDAAIEKGYQSFSNTDFTASVEVSGNRVSVGSLTSSDIQITANPVSTIDHTGDYSFTLSAKKTGLKTNYNIVSSVSPSSVSVFVDKYAEKEFTIDYQDLKISTDPKYYSDVTMSHNTVNVTGAASVIDSIKTVKIQDTINFDSSTPITVQETLLFLDNSGDAVDLQYVTCEFKTIDVTIKTEPRKTVKLAIDVQNAPAKAPQLLLTPSEVAIHGPEDQIDSIEDGYTITIGTLDFRTLTNQNYENLPYAITMPEELNECHLVSDTEDTVSASIDLSDYSKMAVTCEITPRVDNKKFDVEIPSGNYVQLTLYGPESLLSEITEDDILVVADLRKLTEDIESEKTVTLPGVPLTVSLSSDYSRCWASPLDSITVNVTPK